MDPDYHKLKQQIREFVKHTQQAIKNLEASQHQLDENTLEAITNSIYTLENESMQLKHSGEEDLELDMEIIQNFLHSPVYCKTGMMKKCISMYQAAKDYRTNKDPEEIHQILSNCAKNKDSTQHFFVEMHQICEEIDAYCNKKQAL